MRLRLMWLRLHLWLGLGFAPVLVLVGLSGSILVFYREIDIALNRAMLAPPPAIGPAMTPGAILAAGLAGTTPAGPAEIRLRSPRPGETVWSVFVRRGSGLEQIAVDPADGRITGRRDYTNAPVILLYNFHHTLLLRPWWGEELVGITGIALLVSSLTGLWLWWPRGGKWRVALWFKPRAHSARRMVDLHRVVGFYGLAVMLVVAVSGIALTFPQAMRVLAGVAPTAVPKPSAGPARDLDDVLPPGRLDNARLAGGVWRITLVPDGGLRVADDMMLWIDAHDGRLLTRRVPQDQGAAERILAWQFPLHSGEALGMPGRLAVCAVGLTPTVLAVSGYLMWRRKRAVSRPVPGRPG